MSPNTTSSRSRMGALAVQASIEDGIDLQPFVEGDEIHEKIQAMLNATDSLKRTAGSANASVCAKKLPKKKGFSISSRVSRFIDRFIRKPGAASDKTSRREHKECASRESNHPPSTRPLISLPLELQSPTNVEIRVNEGHNLGKGKVQRIVGGSIARKAVPAAHDDADPRVSSEYDADSSDQDTHSFGSFGSLHEQGSECVASAVQEQELPDNPFQIESGFDSYIDDGVLSSLPTGASTPGFPLVASSGDEALVPAESSAMGEIGEPGLDSTNISPRAAYRLEFEDEWSLEDEQHLQIELIRQKVLREGESVKKHPSPSLFRLELLKRGLELCEQHGGLIDREEDGLSEGSAALPHSSESQND